MLLIFTAPLIIMPIFASLDRSITSKSTSPLLSLRSRRIQVLGCADAQGVSESSLQHILERYSERPGPAAVLKAISAGLRWKSFASAMALSRLWWHRRRKSRVLLSSRQLSNRCSEGGVWIFFARSIRE